LFDVTYQPLAGLRKQLFLPIQGLDGRAAVYFLPDTAPQGGETVAVGEGAGQQTLDLAARMRDFRECGSPSLGSGFGEPWKKAARMPLSTRPRTAASVWSECYSTSRPAWSCLS